MRRLLALGLVLAPLFSAAPAPAAPSTTLVISQFRTRGPNGANDEFIDIFNKSAASIAVGGFSLMASDSSGNTVVLNKIPAGTVIGSKHFYLFVNNGSQGFSGGTAPNAVYSQGIPDDGGIALTNASNVIVDAVGMSATSAYVEGTPLTPMTTNVNQSYERNNGGCAATQDTDNNAVDFRLNATGSSPANTNFSCSGCAGVTCKVPPNSQCYSTAGTCTAGACSYTQFSAGTSCQDGDACTVGDTCDASGTCNPGSAATCNTPPANTCSDPQTLVTYSAAGTCSSLSGCAYAKTTTTCPFGCNGSTLQCNTDPCTNVSCTTPPTNGCYDSAGSCLKGSCVYPTKAAKTSCDDGNACTIGDQCDGSGACISGSATPVDDGNPCTVDSCDTTTGTVSHVNATDNTNCDDGNLCNGVATCQSGTCTNSAAVTCTTPPIGGCYSATGTCAPNTGACTYQPLSQNTACDDGQACTTTDVCDGNGTCNGSTVSCNPAGPTCTDSTTSRVTSGGTCQPANGTCSFTTKDTTCTFGCNAPSGLCNADPCIGVVCNTPPSTSGCYGAGTCNGGTCTYPLLASGSKCDDGDPCTTVDQCSSAGACAGTPLLCNTDPSSPSCKDSATSTQPSVNGVCIDGKCGYGSTDFPCSFGCDAATGLCKGDPCATVKCDQPPDQCHQAQGTCSGGTCSYSLKPAESGCDDSNPCTENDVCDASGTCAGADIECNTPPASTCKDANTSHASSSSGTCSSSTGTCTYSATDTACGNGCDSGTGLCKGDPCTGVTCVTPPGSCYLDTGTCAAGVCAYTPRPSAVPCDDSNACTGGDQCDGTGKCVGTSSANCTDGGVTDGGKGTGGVTSVGGATSTGGSTTSIDGGGTTGVGGTANTGGATSTGGVSTGTGGVLVSTGGAVNGSGGSASFDGGVLPDGGPVPGATGGSGSSGCGCSVPNTKGSGPWPLSLLAVSVLALRRRKRA